MNNYSYYPDFNQIIDHDYFEEFINNTEIFGTQLTSEEELMFQRSKQSAFMPY